MADLTPLPWLLVLISHGNYHWPTAILRFKQYLSPPWFFHKYKIFGLVCELKILIFFINFACFTKSRRTVHFCCACYGSKRRILPVRFTIFLLSRLATLPYIFNTRGYLKTWCYIKTASITSYSSFFISTLPCSFEQVFLGKLFPVLFY